MISGEVNSSIIYTQPELTKNIFKASLGISQKPHVELLKEKKNPYFLLIMIIFFAFKTVFFQV